MAAEQVAEQVAEHLEEAAVVTRRINTQGVGLFLGGVAVGVAVGFFFGYRWNKEKIKAEAFAESELEVEKIREQYREAAIARDKPPLEEVVEERGYGVHAVEDSEPERLTRPSVPVQEARPVVHPPEHFIRPGGVPEPKRTELNEKDKNDGWDFATEVQRRSRERPYIIHQDEYAENSTEYSQVTYTYYALDEILTDEGENKVENQDEVIGVHNLHNFGHGSDDYQIVYVRNDRLRMEFEVCLTDQSYEEEVMGLDRDEPN